METGNIPPTLVSLDPSNTEFRKMQIYSVRKSLICIATFDFVLNFLSIISSSAIENQTQKNIGMYSYLAFCLMILLGIIGISRYNKNLVYCYAIYLGLELLGRIFLAFYFPWSLGALIFYWLIILLNIWILKLILKYISNLRYLPEDEIQSLRNGWIPPNFTVIYY
jgi:hypothetical protein